MRSDDKSLLRISRTAEFELRPPGLNCPACACQAQARRRSVTEAAAESAAQPLFPYEREPAAKAESPPGPAPAALAGTSAGKLPALQALQSRVSAVLKPGGGPRGSRGSSTGRRSDVDRDGRDLSH